MKFAVNVVVAFVSFGSITAGAFATDLLVPSEYSSMQGAINAAVDGDTVIVAPGTYNETMTINGKAITIRSSAGASTTKIDRANAGGDVFTINSAPSAGVTIQGFTILRCQANAFVGNGASNVTLNNIRVLTGRRASYVREGSHFTLSDFQIAGMNGIDGNGVYVESAGSSVNATGSNFGACSNVAVYLSPGTSGTLTNCQFMNNSSTSVYGGSGTVVTISGSSFYTCTGGNGGAIGVDSSTLSVSGSTFANCTGGNGGAVFGTNSTISISNCGFTTVKANGVGGVVYLNAGTLTMTACNASDFRAEVSGGVIYTDSATVTVDGLIAENSTTDLDTGSVGGAVRNISGALTVRNSIFRNILVTGWTQYSNQGNYRGAIIGVGDSTALLTLEGVSFANCSSVFSYQYNYYGSDGPPTASGRIVYVDGARSAIFTDVAIVGGTASGSGSVGATVNWGCVVLRSNATAIFSDCVLDGQWSAYGAIYSESTKQLDFTDCSFTNCSNGAIRDAGSNHILNINGCRFQNCTGSGGILVNSATTSLNVSDSIFLNNSRGTPSVGSAIYSPGPFSVFTSVFSGNASFALYMAVPNYCIMGNCAFCGPRPTEVFGVVIDKGSNIYNADCADDCDLDGYPDSYEIATGLDTDCNANGVPDSCDTDTGGADCNNNNIPDSCDIAGGAPDCNLNGVLDSCEADCDNDGIPNACEITGGAPDCNTNGIPDTCEPDCNGDGVIDVCEITSGAPDCNTNGIPDSCDITLNGSLDFNLDGIIDSCQPAMQFAGLQLEIVPIVNRGTDDLFPAGAVCYRLYATTVNTNTAVIGMYGNSANPMVINAVGGFWQSPYGGDLATEIPCDLSSALPTAKYDSWFTIGLPCAAANLAQNGSLDLTGFNSGGGINDNDGIIFVTPNAPQGIAGNSKRVLLAQLTTKSAVFPTGFVDILGRAGGSTASWIASHQQIPAPALVDCNNNGEHDAFDIALGVSLDCDQSGVPDTCEYPSASTDCNSNGIADLCDTISGFSSDKNGNHVPDECECSGDVDGNGHTDVDDLIDVLVAWGDTSYGPADLNQDGIVDSQDLLLVMVGWGNCL